MHTYIHTPRSHTTNMPIEGVVTPFEVASEDNSMQRSCGYRILGSLGILRTRLPKSDRLHAILTS